MVDKSAVGLGLVALVSFFATYGWIWGLQSRGRSAAALDMPDMGMTDMNRYWAFPVLQASGLVALVFAYATVLIGLAQSSSITARLPAHRLHRQLSLIVAGLVAVHVAATVLDAMGNTWMTVLIPGRIAAVGWPAAEWGYDTGIFALYALVLAAPTFYMRRVIGSRRWRILHRGVIIFYVLAVWHALILGLDLAHYSWVRPVIWLAQLPLLMLLMSRLKGAGVLGRRIMVVMSIAVVGAMALLVASGNSDFIRTV